MNASEIDTEACKEAGHLLSAGGLVAFPTETVYGLGANALDAAAVNRIFAAKGRPSDNPLIVHIAAFADAEPLVTHITPMAQAVMQHFWPGPISIILKKSGLIPDEVSAGLDTVALRMPSHPVARAILQHARVPVAAPSANRSGRPSPTTAQHVIDDLSGRIDAVVDGGSCDVGLESTVLDLSGSVPAILRPGAITAEMLEPVIGMVVTEDTPHSRDSAPKAPGMKYKHYAPEARVTVVTGDAAMGDDYISRQCAEWKTCGKRTGVLSCSSEYAYPADFVLFGGGSPEEYGANLFAALRRFDELGADVVYAPFYWAGGYADSVANRLYKSADGRVVQL